jgi:hypothetical protein
MSANIRKELNNLKAKIQKERNNYANLLALENKAHRYAPYEPRRANANRLAQLEKNLNAAINKEGGLVKNLRNAERNLKNIEKNHKYKLRGLLFSNGKNTPEYKRKEKALKNGLIKARGRVNFLKKRINTPLLKYKHVLRKYLVKPGGLLSRIRYEPNYGTEYAKTRGQSMLSKPLSPEKIAKMLREARRQGRSQGLSIGQRRTMKNIFKY